MSKHDKAAPRGPNQTSSSASNPHRRAAVAAAVVVVVGVAVVGVLSARGREVPAEASGAMAAPAAQPAPPPSPLVADHPLHEFGDVPIDGGLVEAEFTITNTGSEPTSIVAAYTSCMCTTAILSFPDGTTEGPFGMPGHDLPVTLDREVGPQESVGVTVRFDPGAHGPDATGPVQRTVLFHTSDGSRTSVELTANVVPG